MQSSTHTSRSIHSRQQAESLKRIKKNLKPKVKNGKHFSLGDMFIIYY